MFIGKNLGNLINKKINTIRLKLGKTVCKTKIQFLLIKIHEEKLNLPCMCPRNDLLFLCTAQLWAWRDFYKGRDDGKHRSMLILSGLSCLRCLQVSKWSTKYSALGLALTHVALQLSHNYDFITYEDRIFLNRCVPSLGIPDLRVTYTRRAAVLSPFSGSSTSSKS